MNPLRILYDFEAFSDQDRGGITRYVLELSKRVAQEEDVLIYAGIHRSLALREAKPAFAHGWYLPPWRYTGELRRHLNAWLTRRSIARFQPDIVHRTYYRHAAPYRGKHIEIVTLYDLTYFRFPDLFPGGEIVQARMRLAVRRAAHAICISHNTRADAIQWLSVDATRSSVIPLGVNPPYSVTASPSIPSPYILFLGARDGYKNFDLVLRAFAESPRLNGLSLIAFGGGPFHKAQLEMIANLGLIDRVHWRQGGDRALAAAYAHAACLVYPSLYEGFGLPLLEAMSYGCPVVCSNTSSLPEIALNAAEYFDPKTPDTLTNALLRILVNPSRRKQLIEAGRSHSAAFTWDQCAEQTLTVYRQIAGRTAHARDNASHSTSE